VAFLQLQKCLCHHLNSGATTMTAKEIILQDRIDTMAYVLAEICRRQRPDLTCEFSDSWEDSDIVSGLLATRSEEELIEEIAPTPSPPAQLLRPRSKLPSGICIP
jgi:hypothetical protein